MQCHMDLEGLGSASRCYEHGGKRRPCLECLTQPAQARGGEQGSVGHLAASALIKTVTGLDLAVCVDKNGFRARWPCLSTQEQPNRQIQPGGHFYVTRNLHFAWTPQCPAVLY